MILRGLWLAYLLFCLAAVGWIVLQVVRGGNPVIAILVSAVIAFAAGRALRQARGGTSGE